MNIADSVIARRLKEGTIPTEELAKYLLDNYPTPVLAMELAECLIEAQAHTQIRISLQELMAHFKIIGMKWGEDGQMVPEGRGSKRWG